MALHAFNWLSVLIQKFQEVPLFLLISSLMFKSKKLLQGQSSSALKFFFFSSTRTYFLHLLSNNTFAYSNAKNDASHFVHTVVAQSEPHCMHWHPRYFVFWFATLQNFCCEFFRITVVDVTSDIFTSLKRMITSIASRRHF